MAAITNQNVPPNTINSIQTQLSKTINKLKKGLTTSWLLFFVMYAFGTAFVQAQIPTNELVLNITNTFAGNGAPTTGVTIHIYDPADDSLIFTYNNAAANETINPADWGGTAATTYKPLIFTMPLLWRSMLQTPPFLLQGQVCTVCLEIVGLWQILTIIFKPGIPVMLLI